MRTTTLLLIVLSIPAARAADNSVFDPSASMEQRAARQVPVHRWEISMAGLVASQSLDAASSWGMRELNPALATRNGTFGASSTALKFGVVGALVGVEYLVVKKYPRAARVFERMNWSGAAVTTGLAVHNYVIR